MRFQVMPRFKRGNATGPSVDGQLRVPHLGRSTFVEQLNAAGREAAHHVLGLCLLDAALMTAGLTDAQRLSDDSHPSEMVGEEMFNMLLNIEESHRRGGDSPYMASVGRPPRHYTD